MTHRGTITVLGEPKPKGSVHAFPVTRTKVRGAQVVRTPGVAVAHRNVPWTETVKWNAISQWAIHHMLRDCPVELRVQFALPRGKTVKRERPHVRPDLDKLLRAVMDGLEGVVYAQDSQVVGFRELRKDYAEPGREGVVIEVWA